ncbi:MAG TPA: DMT family transporter [Acidobacteriota bacterium]|nr:DMT family transporter [Acidobacteriota bacterium]
MILARVLLFFTVVIWGWTFIATKICLEFVTPFELMGLRFLIALPVLLILISIRGVKPDIHIHWRRLLIGSAVITAHFFIQISGLNYTSATNTGWIISVTPLVMAVMAFLILRERISRNAMAGIVIATVGILLLVSRGKLVDLGWLSSTGDWLIMASAHTWALYTIATREVSRSSDPLAVTVAVLLPAAVLVLGIMLFTSDWSRFMHLSTEAIIALLFLGLFGTALAHWFWQEGVARLGAAEAGIFLYLIPVATTALAVPYLGESFGRFTAAGGLLVLAGVWYAQRRPRQ